MPETNEFRDWMDARGLKAQDVAEKFEASPQTISHWRSQGVPERRLTHVRSVMAAWPDSNSPSPTKVIQQLVLAPSREQFRDWNRAALHKGMLIEDWAIEGLDDLAERYQRKLQVHEETPEERWLRENSSKVAEEGK